MYLVLWTWLLSKVLMKLNVEKFAVNLTGSGFVVFQFYFLNVKTKSSFVRSFRSITRAERFRQRIAGFLRSGTSRRGDFPANGLHKSDDNVYTVLENFWRRLLPIICSHLMDGEIKGRPINEAPIFEIITGHRPLTWNPPLKSIRGSSGKVKFLELANRD